MISSKIVVAGQLLNLFRTAFFCIPPARWSSTRENKYHCTSRVLTTAPITVVEVSRAINRPKLLVFKFVSVRRFHSSYLRVLKFLLC
jgi:hypothetical protein